MSEPTRLPPRRLFGDVNARRVQAQTSATTTQAATQATTATTTQAPTARQAHDGDMVVDHLPVSVTVPVDAPGQRGVWDPSIHPRVRDAVIAGGKRNASANERNKQMALVHRFVGAGLDLKARDPASGQTLLATAAHVKNDEALQFMLAAQKRRTRIETDVTQAEPRARIAPPPAFAPATMRDLEEAVWTPTHRVARSAIERGDVALLASILEESPLLNPFSRMNDQTLFDFAVMHQQRTKDGGPIDLLVRWLHGTYLARDEAHLPAHSRGVDEDSLVVLIGRAVLHAGVETGRFLLQAFARVGIALGEAAKEWLVSLFKQKDDVFEGTLYGQPAVLTGVDVVEMEYRRRPDDQVAAIRQEFQGKSGAKVRFIKWAADEPEVQKALANYFPDSKVLDEILKGMRKRGSVPPGFEVNHDFPVALKVKGVDDPNVVDNFTLVYEKAHRVFTNAQMALPLSARYQAADWPISKTLVYPTHPLALQLPT